MKDSLLKVNGKKRKEGRKEQEEERDSKAGVREDAAEPTRGLVCRQI